MAERKLQPLTIYDKYGGYEFFHGCIYDLYIDMFDHPEISYHFIGVNIERLSQLQTQYLIRAIGGPDQYEGRPIKNIHRFMRITAFEFDEIAVAFKNVFLKNGVSIEDTEFIMEFVASHKSEIVTAKSNFMDKLMRPIYRFFKKISKRFF